MGALPSFRAPGLERQVEVQYMNWRGEDRLRAIMPLSVGFGTSEWHRGTQWIMTALDMEDMQIKEFSLKDMNFRVTPPPLEGTPAHVCAKSSGSLDYEPCSRAWGHSGPCAHERKLVTSG